MCSLYCIHIFLFKEEDTPIFKDLQINFDIRDKEVRVIDEQGEQLGVMSSEEANRMADYRNLDLVKISPQATPPVCKFMDYGKYRFELIKKEKELKKNQKIVDIKDVWLSATIDVGDLEVKAKKAREFLEEGDKVRLSIRMKGRQQAHPEVSVEVMDAFFAKVDDVSTIEKKPLHEGRSITMILTPNIKK